jgi:glycosyltransferase involved in cell wall biosynthesis
MPIFKLTIITINFNNLEGLKRTVESVIYQLWQEFEYIIIDGGSTDGSAEYIQEMHSHFDYWVSEPDRGIYHAMNKGIEVARGEYLLFLNSGDYLYNKEVFYNINHHFNYEIDIFAGSLIIDNEEKTIKHHPEKMTFSYITHRTLAHQSTFIKRNLFIKLGLYDESLKIASDWAFFFKALALNGVSYQSIDYTISFYDTTGISSRNGALAAKERDFIFEKYLPYIYNNQKDKFIFSMFKNKNRRIKYLEKIEKTKFIRKIVTVFLHLFYKFS